MPEPTVINNATYQPYDRYVDSHGLRIFSLNGVSVSFIKEATFLIIFFQFLNKAFGNVT